MKTWRLHFDEVLSAGCAVLLACGIALAQTNQQSRRAGTRLKAKFSDCLRSFQHPQEQEIAQERKIEQARASRRSTHARPRNPGSADSRTLSGRLCLRNLGRANRRAPCSATRPTMAGKASRSRFPRIDQTGIGPRPRTPVESGKRNDVAAQTPHASPMLDQTPAMAPRRSK